MGFTFSFLKRLFLWLLLQCSCVALWGHIVIGTWNLQHLGAKKSDSMLSIAASCLRDMDLVAVQEVSLSGGAQAIARLSALLDRSGHDWDYIISEPTTAVVSGESERYAILWRKDKVHYTGRSFLAAAFAGRISREPFIAFFKAEGKTFSLVNFHALPRKKQPETEIRYLKLFRDSLRLPFPVFAGDFNCPHTHTVFLPLKSKGYKPALADQKTTLRQACKDGECLASAYDNIFYPVEFFSCAQAGVVPFYRLFGGDMKAARRLSDHLPVFARLAFR